MLSGRSRPEIKTEEPCAPLVGSGSTGRVAGSMTNDGISVVRRWRISTCDALGPLAALRGVENPHQQVIELDDPAACRAVPQKRLEGRDQTGSPALRGYVFEQRFPVETFLERTGRLIPHAAAQRRDVASQQAKRQHYPVSRRSKFHSQARVGWYLKGQVDECSARREIDERNGRPIRNADRRGSAQFFGAETGMDSTVAPVR